MKEGLHLIYECEKKTVFIDRVIIFSLNNQYFIRNDIRAVHVRDQIAVLRQMPDRFHACFSCLIHPSNLRKGFNEAPLFLDGLFHEGKGVFKYFNPFAVELNRRALILTGIGRNGIRKKGMHQSIVERISLHGLQISMIGLIEATNLFHLAPAILILYASAVIACHKFPGKSFF